MQFESFHSKEKVPPARGIKVGQLLVNTALTPALTLATKPVGLLANIAARKAAASTYSLRKNIRTCPDSSHHSCVGTESLKDDAIRSNALSSEQSKEQIIFQRAAPAAFAPPCMAL